MAPVEVIGFGGDSSEVDFSVKSLLLTFGRGSRWPIQVNWLAGRLLRSGFLAEMDKRQTRERELVNCMVAMAASLIHFD